MARTRGFDLDAALDQIVEVFWRKGYAATSINDLEDATCLNRTSLYAAFGGKEAIFVEALKRYAIRYNDHLMSALRDNPSATAALRIISIGRSTRLSTCACRAAACSPTASSNAVSRTICSRRTSRRNSNGSRTFSSTPSKRPKVRRNRLGLDARRAARLLTAAAEGMTLLARSRYPKDALRDVASGALSLLGISFSAAPASR